MQVESTGARRTRDKVNIHVDEKQRNEHQDELKKKKILELQERLKHGSLGRDNRKDQAKKIEDLSAYKDPHYFPVKEMNKTQIHVDMKNDAIVVPIYGYMVPFHISVIKNVSKQEEGKITLLRLNFFSGLGDKATSGTGNLKTVYT